MLSFPAFTLLELIAVLRYLDGETLNPLSVNRGKDWVPESRGDESKPIKCAVLWKLPELHRECSMHSRGKKYQSSSATLFSSTAKLYVHEEGMPLATILA